MSSIISDIFYNQTNNALLDNYLMHRNTNMSNSGTSLHLANLNHSHTEPDHSRDPIIQQNKVLKLRIVVECEAGGLWEVGLKLGMARVGELGEIGEGKKGVDIGLEIAIDDLYKHNAMSVSVSECSQGMKKRMGVGYLPLESIRDMVENGIKAKSFVVSVKSIRFPYHKIRFTLLVEIKTEDYDFVNERQDEVELTQHHKTPQDSQIDQTQFSQSKTAKYTTNLQNKEIKFIVQNVKIQNFQEDIQFEVSGKMWNIGEQIQITANDIERKGINIKVYSTGDQIGNLHLNILLLFGGVVQGLFPVVSATGECIGTAQLTSSSCSKLTIHPSNVNHNAEHEYEPRNSSNKRQKEIKIHEISQTGYQFQFVSIKLMNKQQFIHPNEKLKIILRTHKDLKIQTKCKVLQSNKFNNILTIIVDKPILILTQKSTQVELEIYLGSELVGYGKVTAMEDLDGQQKGIELDVAVCNLSTNNWVCHVAMNIISFQLPITYFPDNKLQQSLLVISTVHHFLHKLSLSEQLDSNICKLLLEHHQNLIYIQATRISTLISQLIKNNKFIYGIQKQNYNQKPIGDQERMNKLIREIQYLDSQMKGYVAMKDLEAVAGYYGLSDEIIKGAVERRKRQKMEDSDKVLYLLVLEDVLVEMISYSLPQNTFETIQNQSIPVASIPILSSIEVPSVIGSIHQNQQVPQTNTTSLICIRSLQCSSMHLLLPQGKVPSLKVSIPSCQPHFISKIYYSSCNPIIEVNRHVGIGACIIFIHCDIRDKQNGQKEIGRIVVKEGQMAYKIGNGAEVRIKL